jgi:acylphosphatase
MLRAVHVIVEGRVQGVFYRVSAREKALGLGLVGWVRNIQEGRVEIRAEGPEAPLAEFLAWCREGPKEAQVIGLTIQEAAQGDLAPGFNVLD